MRGSGTLKKFPIKPRFTLDLAEHVLPQGVLGIEGQTERHGNPPEFVLGAAERLATELDEATQLTAGDQFFGQFDRRTGTWRCSAPNARYPHAKAQPPVRKKCHPPPIADHYR